VRYLQFAREFSKTFPGFDTDIHGLVEENAAGELRYFIDCVRKN
jgi:arginine decarboxylase